MTKTTLRTLVETAESAIDIYRHPDVREAQERLNEIIVAAGLGNISHDRLVHINVGEALVILRTEYTVRSCEQSDEYEFPTSILDAENPVHAATLWGLRTKRDRAKREVLATRLALARSEAALAETEAEIANFEKAAV